MHQKSARQILNEDTRATGMDQSFDIFLSHSYADARINMDQLLGLKAFLEDFGHTVYVDWIIDNTLSRENVDERTADTLRKRMTNSRCLLFATSENSILSKWMPWELGYKDGQTTTEGKTGMVAILPLSDNANRSFNGQEYLGIYPHVERLDDNLGRDRLWIFKGEKTYVSLEGWISGEPFRELS